MKLYLSPGACSLSPHIVLEESGLKYEWEKIDVKNKTVASGDYFKINSKGQVPTLQLDNGSVLTEGSAIVQYIADQVPDKKLIPKFGTMERYHAMEWLNYVATEVHKGFGPLWGASRIFPENEASKKQMTGYTKGLLDGKMTWLNAQLKPNSYLMGEQFTVVDAYLYTCLRWSKSTEYDLTKFSAIMGLMEKIQNRPAVQKVLKDEGLT
jgi:glutathione S-transferase